MKIIEQFIEPSYIPQKGDVLIFKYSSKERKGILKRIITDNNRKDYYIKVDNNQWIIPTVWIKYVERTITGACNLPATKDLLNQLQPGDKVLLKTKKENPQSLRYNPNCIFASMSKHLGTEITVNRLTILPSDTKTITSNNGTLWFYNEIKAITFIKK